MITTLTPRAVAPPRRRAATLPPTSRNHNPLGGALARASACCAARHSTICRWSRFGCQQSSSMRPCRPVPCRALASLARAALAHPAAPDLALCSATCIGEHAASQQQLRLPAVPLHAAASRVVGSGVTRKRRSGLPCCSRSRASLAWRIALRKRFCSLAPDCPTQTRACLLK